ncbi:CHAD domain-containing protein [Sphingobium sp.]|uniref:CYTH and CHAD domain-containing protein n=1 Tax=Sphingobium sp. TaxID=1912891 RepID=UPI003BB79898
MNREIELKLDLPHDGAEAFLQWPSLPSDHDIADLHATYLDTPDRDLAQRGVSLRIRRSGDQYIQTVKADGDGATGLFSRNEWEVAVSGDTPVLDDNNPVAAMLGDAITTLVPLFKVDVERRTWSLREGDTDIELVLDRGTVTAGDRQALVCEIELELKSGDPAALFALAQRIAADHPTRPGVMTKSERGHRLREPALRAVKAEAVTLDPAMTAGTAFARIAHACLRHYALNEALLRDHYDPAAVHQARVAIRRLRSAFWLFKPILPVQDVDRFSDDLRWWAAILGEARDLDVLAKRIGDDPSLESARTSAHQKVTQWLASARVRLLTLDLIEWLTLHMGQGKGADRPATEIASRRLRKLRRRIRKNGRDMATLSDEARHAVRKDAKKLRYASEFLAGLFDGGKQVARRAKFIKALSKMQERLGDLNDLATMPTLMARHGLKIDDASYATSREQLLLAAAKAHHGFADRRRFWA